MTFYTNCVRLFLAREASESIIECFFVNQPVETFKWEGGHNPTGKQLLNATSNHIFKVVMKFDKNKCLLPGQELKAVMDGDFTILESPPMEPSAINACKMVPWLRLPNYSLYPGAELGVLRAYCRGHKHLTICRIEHLNEFAAFETT